MVPLLIIAACVGALLVAAEVLWRRQQIDPEYTRKFVHITVGSLVAFWPLFLGRWQIITLSAAFVVVVLVSSRFSIFRAIHSVQRPTWGELFFALAVGVLAYVSRDSWVYMAALLHMSLADGLAAVVGTKFGKRTRYHLFGHQKSIVGTAAFVIVSLGILSGYAAFGPHAFSPWFPAITLLAAALENVAIRGVDNLMVPLAVAIALNAIR